MMLTSNIASKFLLITLVLLGSTTLGSSALMAAQCKVHTLQLNSVKQLQPAQALDSYGREAISTITTSVITQTGLLNKLIGHGISKSATLTKIHQYQFKGIAVGHKTADSLFSNAVKDPLDALINGIDQSVDTRDDLMIRLGGKKILPQANLGMNYFSMGINEVYPDTYTMGIPLLPVASKAPMTMPFIGGINLQIIEYDVGSKNDNLGDIDITYVPDDECAYGPGVSCNDAVITVLSSDHGDDENGAIYEVDYEIIPDSGDLNDIPERLLCNSSECFDADNPLAYQYDFTFPENKPCPVGYDEGAGYYHVKESVTDLIADSYRVCELLPHLVSDTPYQPCGSTYWEAEGSHSISDVAEIYNLLTTNITIKSNALVPYTSDGNATYLSSYQGQYLGQCDDCLNPFSTAIHIIDPNRKVANWQLKKLTNGKYSLISNDGLYLTYVNTDRYPLMLQDVSENNPIAQFTIENAVPGTSDNNYHITTTINGEKRYLSACLDCDSINIDNKLGYRYSATFHQTTPTTNSVWEIDFSMPETIYSSQKSPNGDGIFDYDLIIKSNEKVIADTMTLMPARTLTIETGGILEVRGTFINHGNVEMNGSGLVINDGVINNNGLIILSDQTVFENNRTLVNDGDLVIRDNSVFANTIHGRIINKHVIDIIGGTMRNMGIIDNNLAHTLNNNSYITSSIGNDTNTDNAQIYDPNKKYTGNGVNTNAIIDGYYLGFGLIGEHSCQILGGSFSNNICTLGDYWLPFGKTLRVDSELALVGTLKNHGTITNDRLITNTNGNINQCGIIDVDGATGNGQIVNPLAGCIETSDESICTSYKGQFTFRQPDAKDLCVIPANNPVRDVSSPLIISSGVSWQHEGTLRTFSEIYIEPDAELIIKGGYIENLGNLADPSKAYINNQGLLSVEIAADNTTLGTLDNNGLIKNPGTINNYANVIGGGTIQNICNGSYNVFPDWDTRTGAGAAHNYDVSGRNHIILSNQCYPFDSDFDTVPDTDDAFPYDPAETQDSDSDGVGDNVDVFPNDPAETTDSDGDGVGDNGDAFPNDPNETLDTDGDGLGDNADVFPNDPNETQDSDGDGVGDNGDAFPNDATESADSDWDGTGDNADPYPNDRDNLRIINITNNNGWVFKNTHFTDPRGETPWNQPPQELYLPHDVVQFELEGGIPGSTVEITIIYPEPLPPASQWWYQNVMHDSWKTYANIVIDGNTLVLTLRDGDIIDSDNEENGQIVGLYERFNVGGPGLIDRDKDGTQDTDDAFPDDPSEWLDTDGDGIGNNADPDDDNDTVPDTQDVFPNDPTEWEDNDADGVGNNSDPDDDNDGFMDTDDAFPFDPTEWLDTDNDGTGNNTDLDDDNDTVPDTQDVFPNDPTEWEDTDADGVGNNSDPDDDNDGIIDTDDAEPLNAAVGDSQAPAITLAATVTFEATGPETVIQLELPEVTDNNLNAPDISSDYSGEALSLGSYTVTWTAVDFAGNTATATQEVFIVDTTAPEFGELEILTINASGLYTDISDAIHYSATDLVDGDISASMAATLKLMSGEHQVTLSAIDASGNTANEVLYVHILPWVELGSAIHMPPDSSKTVYVSLSGVAPVYPVLLEYQFGDSNQTIQSDEITIASGTEAALTLTAPDSVADNSTQQLTITSATNAWLVNETQMSIHIQAQNYAPEVDVIMTQQDEIRTVIDPAQGMVTLAATISDVNNMDNHSIEWLPNDTRLQDLSTDLNDSTFVFNPEGLENGRYGLSVHVTETNTVDGLSNLTELALLVDNAIPALNGDVDSDADGIDDASEGYGDSDNDGIADYLDNSTLSHLTATDSGEWLQTMPGLRFALGNTVLSARGVNARFVTLTPEELANYGGPDGTASTSNQARHYSVYGPIYNFRIDRLASLRAAVPVVIPLQAGTQITADSVLRKHSPELGWYDFVVDNNNYFASAQRDENGNCPEPLSEDYVSGLNVGDNCLHVLLEDGGPNDVDGSANGKIEDPLALTTFSNQIPTVTIAPHSATVVEGNTVSITSDASDDDGDTLSYQWEYVSGPTVDLTGASSSSLSLTVPQVMSSQTLTISVTVSDGYATATAITSIQIENNLALEPTIPSKSGGGSTDLLCLVLLLLSAGLIGYRQQLR